MSLTHNVATLSRGEVRAEIADAAKEWRYRELRVGPLKLPHYASPIVQLILVALAFFLCPGMYNALSGLGGGGQLDATVSNNATVALYSTFAVVAFFSGTVCNKLGVRVTLSIGCFGYALYVASFLCYNHTKNGAFVIAAGALLGVCAALLWAAESVIMISYPMEHQKGKYIGIFWMIFNMGGVIGSVIPLAQSIHSNSSGSVSDNTYIIFIVLTALGFVLSMVVCNADKIVRRDGSKILVMLHPTWKSELLGLFNVLRTEAYIVALFPLFLASNWFYTYQFNDFNLARFDVRTRSLNSVLYWSAQIFSSYLFGMLLDTSYATRTTRARIGLGSLFALTMGVWGGGYAFQKTYTRQSASLENSRLDWSSGNYSSLVVLYIVFGAFDAIWQTYVYWTLGALSNNSRKLAILAGFYKSIQSAGAAVVYRLDALKLPYMNIFASTWALCAVGLGCAAPVIWFRVGNHTEVTADLEFIDGIDGVKKEDIQASPTVHTVEDA